MNPCISNVVQHTKTFETKNKNMTDLKSELESMFFYTLKLGFEHDELTN